MRSIHIDHGNPMNALLDTPFTQAMKSLGTTLIWVKAIIILSAHNITEGKTLEISTHPHPLVIYDMYGFPPELYRVVYNVNTEKSIAEETTKILTESWIQNRFNPEKGIDHGIWSVLIHLFPEGNIPIVPISVVYDAPVLFHYTLGKVLSEKFGNDILFISSGNIVHNLRLIDWSEKLIAPWAHDFDQGIYTLTETGNTFWVLDYRNISGASLAVPTPDHFFPFVSFMGASEWKSIVSMFSGFELGNISTRIYKNF